jgi:hypothetical protein
MNFVYSFTKSILNDGSELVQFFADTEDIYVETVNEWVDDNIVSTISDIRSDSTNTACYCHPQYVQILVTLASRFRFRGKYVCVTTETTTLSTVTMKKPQHRKPDHVLSDTIALSEPN